MMSSLKTLVRQGENLYEVIETFGASYFYKKDKTANEKLVEFWKDRLKPSIILNTGSSFLFCKSIEELEFEMVQDNAQLLIES